MNDFKVQGQLGLDGSGFFSTLGRAEGALGKIGGVLAGAFSVGAVAAFSKAVINLAGELNDVSDALGINVEFLQRFLNSAAKSGGGLGDIEKFLFESNKARQAALNNAGGAESAAFQKLGFSREDISKMNPQQFIEQIIKAFADGATPQEMNAISEIGGRSAKNLVGGFKDGLDNVTAIISEDTIAVLDELGDRFTMLGTTIKSIVAPFFLTILNFLQGVVDLAQAVGAFYGGLMARGRISDAVDQRDRVLLEQTERDRASKQRLEEKKAVRRSREIAPNLFAAEPVFGKKASSAKLYSDSLLSVGNFLGSGKSTSLAGIAEQQLQVAVKSEVHLAKIAANIAINKALSLIIP